ncbi:MAG: sensory transduction histidine kinase [Bryobacterales bacterium]|jgi:chemotaxis family two-component system sensor kinase Cph1|nr:sensory transduction histidine kinase [Bryobacterales bacterium]
MRTCSRCGAKTEMHAGGAPICPACVERFELAADAAKIGFHESLTPEGQQIWNPAMERLFGLVPGTFEGTYTDWVKRIHPEDRASFEASRRAWIEQGHSEFKFQYRILLADGQIRWMEERSRLFFSESGSLTRIAGASIDVTELRESQQAQKQRSTELARANEELQRFVYAVAHDLQEPLRGIGTMTQLFLNQAGGTLQTDSARLLDSVLSNADRMKRLIQDVLEFARIGDGPGLKAFDIDSGSVVGLAVKNLRQNIDESGAKISFDSLPIVRANDGQLLRVFQNLIANAIKYRAERMPEVHVSAASNDEEWIFSVRDNGIGIDPKYHDQIFGTFQRLHSRAEYEGNGLGLAICKRIIERHDGRIWVESESGKGATFYFTIPKQAEEAGRTLRASTHVTSS